MLVHCGAGVSRSAALVIAYLMRRFTWPAERARQHARARRSLVNPNQGFWRQLCAFEAELGITQRCAVLLRQGLCAVQGALPPPPAVLHLDVVKMSTCGGLRPERIWRC